MNKLLKVKIKSKKRVGRGRGSGKGGHTVGRGQKGQKARGSVHILFEGLKTKKSLIKRLPLKRGKDKNKTKSVKSKVVDIKKLNTLENGTIVNLETLIKNNIVKAEEVVLGGVKILGDGKLDKKLTVLLPASEKAKKSIIEVGGKLG